MGNPHRTPRRDPFRVVIFWMLSAAGTHILVRSVAEFHAVEKGIPPYDQRFKGGPAGI